MPSGPAMLGNPKRAYRLWGSPPLSSQRQPTIRETTGTGTLLVLLDTSRSECLHLPDMLFSALGHFGMPYRVWDIPGTSLRAEDLLQHRAVVIAQEHFGESLRPEDVGELLRAVEAGVGLVNFDHDVSRFAAQYAESLGLPRKGMEIVVGDSVSLHDTSAFITWTREAGERVAFRRPVPVCRTAVKSTAGWQPLVLADETPALAVRPFGHGRVVQWLVSPKVWLPEVLGHARGLDDLFWKGIIWAARKPFLMKAMPPFVRMRLDDCKGYWRDGRDFDFVDVLNEAGHIPNLGLCLRAVSPDGGRRIKRLFDEGKAEFSPHTLSSEAGLFYGDESGEYSTARFAELMEEMDLLLREWGIRPSRVLSDHNHMWSERVIPFLL